MTIEMRRIRSARVMMTALGVVIAFLVAPPATMAQAPSQELVSPAGGPFLEGTWKARITLRNCSTWEPLAPSFPAMVTFAWGGTMTTADGGLSPAQRGPGHGNWKRTGPHTFQAVSEAFLFAPTGAMVGTQRLTQTIDLSPRADEFQSTVSAAIVGIDGNPIAAGCASSEGRRLE